MSQAETLAQIAAECDLSEGDLISEAERRAAEIRKLSHYWETVGTSVPGVNYPELSASIILSGAGRR